jgi:uncharacterized phage infection (PIP) family protein YhgE
MRISDPKAKHATKLKDQNSKLKDQRVAALQKVAVFQGKLKEKDQALKENKEALKQQGKDIATLRKEHQAEVKKLRDDFKSWRHRHPDHIMTKQFKAIAAMSNKVVGEKEAAELMERFCWGL